MRVETRNSPELQRSPAWMKASAVAACLEDRSLEAMLGRHSLVPSVFRLVLLVACADGFRRHSKPLKSLLCNQNSVLFG